jgi:hypothetical protein
MSLGPKGKFLVELQIMLITGKIYDPILNYRYSYYSFTLFISHIVF